MAKKREVNKAKAVRDYLKSQPDAMSGEVAKALNKQGIDITSRHVSAIYSKLNKTNKLKPGQKRCPSCGASVAGPERKPARSAAGFSFSDLRPTLRNSGIVSVPASVCSSC